MGKRDSGDSPRTMALAIAALYATGAAVGALTLLLPHTEGFRTPELWSNVGLACVGSIACALLAGRIPVWGIHVIVAAGTLIVTRAIYLSPEAGGFYSFWYVWVGLYAFFFFGRRGGLAHTALMGAAYGWVLTQADNTMPLARWTMTISTVAVAGLLIDALGQRLRRRASEADARARALAAVSSVAHELSRRTTPEAAGPAVCEAALEVADAKGALLLEPTGDGAGLVATASTDPKRRGLVIPFLGEASGSVKAFITGEPFFVSDAPSNPAVHQGLVEELGVASILFQPIKQAQATIGVLAVYWGEPIAGLDSDLARVVVLLGDEASLAIERAELFGRLERAAHTDQLTGLPNRRSWEERLGRELARAGRQETPLSVAMLDLDHFKDYNDRHGHQAGDRLLKEAAASWRNRLRDSDLLARHGGEEFALALPGCELAEAELLVEQLREATPDEQRCSAGVVCWDTEESPAALMDRADRALYMAKRGGRDQVVSA